MIKIFKKIDWPLVYIFVIFGALFLWMGKPLLFGADGDPLIAGVNRGKVIGQIYPININITSTSGITISGASKFGGWITGVSNIARSGVSFLMESSAGQGENVLYYLSNDTAQSGASMYVLFPSGDTIISTETITAGISKYVLSGTTLTQRLLCLGAGVSTWTVISVGSPAIDWD